MGHVRVDLTKESQKKANEGRLSPGRRGERGGTTGRRRKRSGAKGEGAELMEKEEKKRG